MPEPDFKMLARRMLDEGVRPRVVRRAVGEIRDHYEDLLVAAREDGLGDRQARRQAAQALGHPERIVAAMSAERGLKTWAFRYPRLAIVVYPLACLALVPAAPIVAGVDHAQALARWGASLLAAGLVTAGLLLVMQLSILFG
jgi:hypothetical protein